VPPAITVVGLGPAGEDLLDQRVRALVAGAETAFLRTSRHPAASAFPGVPTFDHHYDQAASFEEVYDRIVADLVTAAQVVSTTGGSVVYAVPGSPLVAERTVELLRRDPRVEVTVVPALSFVDLAWARLGVDPFDAGARLVDGTRFAEQAAGQRGPLLVAQCWAPSVLSDMKLALGDAVPTGTEATVLHHLGLPDEVVTTVAVDELDRLVEPDHLTSVWLPAAGPTVAAEVVALDELVRKLRAECPWDRRQTHASLTRHLLEESYEVIDSIDALERAGAGDHGARAAAATGLEEELGDLLFQICFQSRLAAEEGWFTLADVARGVHDKLVSRHPHVFGDVVAHDAGTVLANWEQIKKAEKGRRSVTDGIPAALPALALSAKLQRKAATAVPELAAAPFAELQGRAVDAVGRLVEGDELAEEVSPADDRAQTAATLLWTVSDLARRAGVEPEDALRAAALRFRARVRAAEGVEPEPPGDPRRRPGDPRDPPGHLPGSTGGWS
jgi:tetrapyrrole methylase family protein / MazG family protein